MKVGYIRTSTAEQNIARQEILMQELGVDKVYVDQLSGKNTERPQLQAMLNYVREGDTVIVESISRFARNTKDLLELVEQLKEKNVTFISKKETIDTNTAAGQFMLTVFGAMAQLERDYILDRQREGIAVAKSKGVYKGRQAIEVDTKAFESVYKAWKAGDISAKKAMQKLDLKPNTFYRRVKEFESGK
ncbi:recombinase family protein [Caproiciproducens sp. LBM24188]